jgi:hypothetical protein
MHHAAGNHCASTRGTNAHERIERNLSRFQSATITPWIFSPGAPRSRFRTEPERATTTTRVGVGAAKSEGRGGDFQNAGRVERFP